MNLSTSIFSSTNNNHNRKMMQLTSLPSPPISTRQPLLFAEKRMPTFMVDPAHRFRNGFISDDTRYTPNNNQQRHDGFDAELRPFLFNSNNNNSTEEKERRNNSKNNSYYLPSIQNVMMTTPTSSPSPPFVDSYFSFGSSSSPLSSIASSPTAVVDDEDDYESYDEPTLKKKQHKQVDSVRRKGSIASLLNSDPELKQLDEEESKCNYQSHFIDNCNYQQQKEQPHQTNFLKRGRPRQDHCIFTSTKKQRRPFHDITNIAHNTKQVFKNNSLIDDSLQACQSSIVDIVTGNTTVGIATSDSSRATKGLRHFSKQVCDKVAEKGVTTYNEVADELAFDIQNSQGNEKHSYDQKNIRRRVYDALNVLMAMNIIAKEKKIIKWLGIPECYKQQQVLLVEENQDDLNNDAEEEEYQKKLLLLQQIEQEELLQNELTNSLNVLRDVVNSKLSKSLQIRDITWRNQQEKYNSVLTPEKVSMPFFIVSSSSFTSTGDEFHIDIQDDSRSATISFDNDTSSLNIYSDVDILRHLQQSQ